MADPICRWRNSSVKQVIEFNSILPLQSTNKALARKHIDYYWNLLDGKDFFSTAYQLAVQMGLYYEDENVLHPRFEKLITVEEASKYINSWAKKYYAPNPYTKSMNMDQKPIIINDFLVNWAVEHDDPKFSEALKSMFNDVIGNTDILVNMLNNFSDVIITNDMIALKEGVNNDLRTPILANVDPKDKRFFFEYFGGQYRLDKIIKAESHPLQQIHYGAPGTGKSFGIDEEIKKNKYKSIRTTFHPDSDYSTFVGCYKPQMDTVIVRDDRGFPVKENGQIVSKKEIVYKYSPQAFLKAYVKAWKNINEPVVLVIEEINRGNCAQIFGDIFQLLDRNAAGYSSYPINADEDILQYLNNELAELTIDDAETINSMYEDDVMADVLNGSKLLLPKNMYIWATMNTSDQSLFPIDSAFKRRWDWKYVRISEGRDRKTGALIKNTIEIDDEHKYDWWEFLQAINQEIGNATLSEDKKLGFFFCKATNNVIDAELFVAKVIFYLWNDVFKDADTELFNVLEDGNQPTFDQFYTEDAMGSTIVNKEVVVKFIEKVMKSVE